MTCKVCSYEFDSINEVRSDLRTRGLCRMCAPIVDRFKRMVERYSFAISKPCVDVAFDEVMSEHPDRRGGIHVP